MQNGMKTVFFRSHASFAEEDALVSHTHHEPDSPGSDCYNCHMPNTAYGLHKATRNHLIDSPDASTSVGPGRPNACNLCHLDRTLAWTAEHLEAWYGTPQPELGARDREVAAGVRWVLSGDAGQRAIAAWHMGWEPAQRASGTDWTPAYLAHLFVDRYAAVRSVAYRALEQVPGYEDVSYDFVAPPSEREESLHRVLARWSRRPGPHARRDALLLDARGQLELPAVRELIRERDDRPLYLAE